MAKELGVLRLASWGVSLVLGSFTHNPLILEMSPKEDSEHFSVNYSFYVTLDASSPSAGLCGDSRPHRDQDVPQRHRPSCQCSREIAVTHTGQENRMGAIGEARTRERWREVSTNPQGPERLASVAVARTPPTLAFADPSLETSPS